MKALLFAHLKIVTGQAELRLTLEQPVNTDALWQKLAELHPELVRHRPSVRLARNGEYVGSEVQFADTDEVALIPPVSGG